MLQPEQIVDHNRALEEGLAVDVEHLSDSLGRYGKSAVELIEALVGFSVGAPSWAVGTGGTRFGRFPVGGEPRTTEEKIDDVAALNSLTASNESISLHVPWDLPDDPAGLKEYAGSKGIWFDAMNSNTFQDNPSTTDGGDLTYKFGSLANSESAVREVAVQHNKEVIDLGAHSTPRRQQSGWPTVSTIPVRPTIACSSSMLPKASVRYTITCRTDGRCTPSTSRTSRPSTPLSTSTG